MTAHLQNSIYVRNFSVLFQTYGSFMNEIGKKLLLMTFLIRRSTYNNSLNCVTVLNSHRVILMEQLIPFIEWRGFALEFRLLISFFIGAYFTERGLYFDFDVWTSKEGDIFKEKKISKLHTYYDSKYFVNILMLIDWGFQLWYIFKHLQKEEKSLHHACFTKFYFAAQCYSRFSSYLQLLDLRNEIGNHSLLYCDSHCIVSFTWFHITCFFPSF